MGTTPSEYHIIIPEWLNYYQKSAVTRPKYWLWKDREKLPKKYKDILRPSPLTGIYCCDAEGNKFLKNSKKVGTPNLWMLNGQDLYNAALNWRVRKSVAILFHEYFSEYIKEQVKPIVLPEGKFFSISCDIYEIKRGNMPDVSNMWLLEKFFEDALQICGIIPEDSPDYVIESGRKRYFWVENASERKLIFTIKII